MRILQVLTLLGFLVQSGFAQPEVKADFRLENDKEVARERAILPFIAKARATYPAVKRRFLAGLPQGHQFAVMVRLYAINKAKKEVQLDDVFVSVDSITLDKIYGHINSPVFIPRYRQGQLLSFAESEIINWVILRPDGSEEGNFVGKFMDHYKPK
jgi:hypothetical protein